MAPLEEHYDGGFGAMAIAFRQAALVLSKTSKPNTFLDHLPLSYLLRHCVELYLKSGIVILHRRFKLSFGEEPWNGMPMVLSGTEWKPFQKVHSVATLFGHWENLITPNAVAIQDACQNKPDWTVPGELREWIKIIEGADKTSTFYRYPSTEDSKENDKKSSFKEIPVQEIFEVFRFSVKWSRGVFR